MRILAALLITVLAPSAFAAGEACPGFNESDAALWAARQPANPGSFRLGRAYLTYRRELKNVAGIRNDKHVHCYMGCRMAQDVDAATVLYVAWLKEDRDLRDCKTGTHFDPADETATNLGAELATRADSARACMALCMEALPRR